MTEELLTASEIKTSMCPGGQYYYGHGKILLTGEYFVLDGACALALPTRFGQSLLVNYKPSYNPKLHWKSYDVSGKLWFEGEFEFWHFDYLGGEVTPQVQFLQNLLRQARAQNSHFLREETDVFVETRLGFPLDWGLGSSSSLIFNIAQWAYVSPFELLFKTTNGSGYDMACAQSSGPILYEKRNKGPHWSLVDYDPPFKDHLYFVYLGNKRKTVDAIKEYKAQSRVESSELLEKKEKIGRLTMDLLKITDLRHFEEAINAHEDIIGPVLGVRPVKERLFGDFWGSVKSLGAWGGDFALVTSERGLEETKKYFHNKGLDIVLPYDKLILPKENGFCNTKNYDDGTTIIQ
jgi:mevalonate kinase